MPYRLARADVAGELTGDLGERVASSAVDFRTTPCGGHVGFIGGSAPWRCEYWADELVVRWLLEKAG